MVHVFFGGSGRDMSTPMTNRPILVTGGWGLLGRSLAERASQSQPILSLDRASLDISDPEAIALAIARFEPGVIVNAAAMTDVDGCERDPAQAVRANVDGPRMLAEACARSSVQLVHVSTDFVFDGMKREPYTIDDVPNPISVYGSSKFDGERAVFAALPDAVVARTSWLFGVGGKNFASRIFEYAATSNRLKGIVDMRSLPTYAPDCAIRLLELIALGVTGTFHVVGGGEPASWFELARATLDAAGRHDVELVPVTTADLGLPAPRPAYSAMRCLRSEALGLSSLRPWNEAIRDFAAAAAATTGPPPK